jgi:hypothetical protein
MKMDSCFAVALDAHWTCKDEVKSAESRESQCYQSLDQGSDDFSKKWGKDGPGLTIIPTGVKIDTAFVDADADFLERFI